MKKIMIAAAAAALAFGLSACGGSSDEPAPAPTVTVTEAPSAPTGSAGLAFLETTWEGFTPAKKADACDAWRFSPDLFWIGFKKGLGQDLLNSSGLTETEFYTFMSDQCIG